MPGLTGIEAARQIAGFDNWRGEIVFATAYDEYAVTAFEEGAVDYLLKPVERARLDITVARLRARLVQQHGSPQQQDALLHTLAQLQARLSGEASPQLRWLRWLQCGSGSSTRLVNVADVLFFRSDEKFTRVQLAGQEAFIRTPIRELIGQLDPQQFWRELIGQLDPQQFWQIHRACIVNLSAIATVQRDDSGRQRVTLKQHPEVLEVSRSFGHVFRAA
ncbi:MAG: LytR/AlgR family response regulator transcription factor [Rhodoferax sp.]